MYADTILPFFITYVSTFYIKFISTWTFFHSKHGQKGAFCQLPASPCPRSSNCTTPNVHYASDYDHIFFFRRDDHRLLYLSLRLNEERLKI